jgi:hypothetical protein
MRGGRVVSVLHNIRHNSAYPNVSGKHTQYPTLKIVHSNLVVSAQRT